jgi:hypothetical protein
MFRTLNICSIHVKVTAEELAWPSDGTFESQIVKKRRRRLSGVEDMVTSLRTALNRLVLFEVTYRMTEVGERRDGVVAGYGCEQTGSRL